MPKPEEPKPEEAVDEIRFFVHDDETDSPGNEEPGGDVWINAADLVRAIKSHETAIVAGMESRTNAGIHRILRDAIGEVSRGLVAAIGRLIVKAHKLKKRGSN